MNKDFDAWNEQKKQINVHTLKVDFYYYQREVWWCALGANVAVEADGKSGNFERPVLVLRKFNKEMFWGVPLTGQVHSSPFYFELHHEAGTSWAMLSQMRTISSKRLLRKIGMVSESDFLAVVKAIRTLLTIEPLLSEGLSEAEATNT